ncbi:TRAP transporter fused permease subunit [Bacillus aerolatus]|uniref:TRAP transporter fused permease subunit n=1 Tax=Bacillus aerolatus TaxID=2653354 RepID=A0A6I1FEZ4_9BACI|nr:TRAP transporter permease [Bacillus aerolatus]KAB7706526.1 TRAP transporter fused permease subunit [Bacillus aerolatus]
MDKKADALNLDNIQIEPDSFIDKIMQKKVTGSKLILFSLIAALGITMSIVHLYTSGFGIFSAWQQRSITLCFTLLLIPFLFPFKKRTSHVQKVVDSLYFITALITAGYIIFSYPDVVFRESTPTQPDLIIGTVLVLLVLEATRRSVGWAMTIIVALFIMYVFFGQHLQGLLGHPGISFQKAISTYFNTTQGIFGIILGAMSNYIITFIIFGAFLAKSKAGKFFIELSYSLTGAKTGGPAKVAVVASGLMGTISGAAVSNVATTGTLTIPLMKRVGYKGHFAGGVEAAASSGGQLMPPVMGAAAFIIAANLQIPYAELMLYALIPALLHYFAVYYMVHFEAKKNNLIGLKKEELPDLKKVFIEGWFLLLPIILIIGMLMGGYSPQIAGFYSILAIIFVSLFRKNTRMSIQDILSALELGAKNSVSITAICAAAGLLISSVNLTGLGLKFSSVVLNFTSGSLILSLIFIMLASIILGMGMPTVSAYVILAVLGVPALVQIGVDPLAAHLFVFYFAIMSNVTPPVAVAAYTAAAIAESDPTKTGFSGLKICLGTFIIPYMFVFGPELLLQGELVNIVIAVVTAMIGIICLASALQGWLFQKMNVFERAANIVGAVLLIDTGWITDIIGISIFLVTLINQHRKQKEKRHSQGLADSSQLLS